MGRSHVVEEKRKMIGVLKKQQNNNYVFDVSFSAYVSIIF